MWALFLIGAMSTAVCALLIVYLANKIFIAMKKDQQKFNQKRRK